LKNCTNSLLHQEAGGSVEETTTFFQKYTDAGSPFDISKDNSEEDIYAASRGKSSKDRRRSHSKSPRSVGSDKSNDEDEDENESKTDESESENGISPTITNTSLTILRLFGR